MLANGRPDLYPAVQGSSAAGAPWFARAMRTGSGDDFAASDIAREPMLKDAPVATFATAIREGGKSNGRPLGVLGIHFDWRPQAQAVVDGVRLTPEERARSRVMILDKEHRVLAASDGRNVLQEVFALDTSGGALGSYGAGSSTVGYAVTPGYETYKGMGWYGCVVQGSEAEDADGEAMAA